MTIAGAWSEAVGPTYIRGNEVHVWRASLECSPAQLIEHEALLRHDELERARRFRFDVHRNRYVLRRGVLRLLLSRYLQISPMDIELEYTPHGKPVLAKRHGSNIRFNLSHSRDLALFVLTDRREVGIDIEYIQPDFSDHAIPERFFAPGEAAMLRALTPAQQPEAFFELWVRKEAYVKARGLGLSLALDSFEVPLGDGEAVRPLGAVTEADAAGCWTMHALRPAPGYAAALVVEGRTVTPCCWTWSFRQRPGKTTTGQ